MFQKFVIVTNLRSVFTAAALLQRRLERRAAAVAKLVVVVHTRAFRSRYERKIWLNLYVQVETSTRLIGESTFLRASAIGRLVVFFIVRRTPAPSSSFMVTSCVVVCWCFKFSIKIRCFRIHNLSKPVQRQNTLHLGYAARVLFNVGRVAVGRCVARVAPGRHQRQRLARLRVQAGLGHVCHNVVEDARARLRVLPRFHVPFSCFKRRKYCEN